MVSSTLQKKNYCSHELQYQNVHPKSTGVSLSVIKRNISSRGTVYKLD